MDESMEKVYSEISALAKRLNIQIIVKHEPKTRPIPSMNRYVIRFTMKRRWGGVKKYAYECSLGTLAEYVAQIERSGGKIIGID